MRYSSPLNLDKAVSRFISSEGYRCARFVCETTGKQFCVAEHRVIMENILGRLLHKDEVIHHRNHIKTDNSPSNLEVMHKWRHMKLHGRLRILANLQRVSS